MVPEQSKGTTKGLRIIHINSADPCVLNSIFLDYRLFIILLQLPVTSNQRESVAAISSSKTW